jgi:hypothetical protein
MSLGVVPTLKARRGRGLLSRGRSGEPESPTRCSLLAQVEVALSRVLVSMVAVAQTLGEAAGSFLRVGSETGDLILRARCVRPEVARPSRSAGHLRDGAAAFPRRLSATATMQGDGSFSSNSIAGSVGPALSLLPRTESVPSTGDRWQGPRPRLVRIDSPTRERGCFAAASPQATQRIHGHPGRSESGWFAGVLSFQVRQALAEIVGKGGGNGRRAAK